VIVVWALLLPVGIFAAGQVSKRLSIDFSLPGQPGYEAAQKITHAYGNGGDNSPTVIVVTVPIGQTVKRDQAQIARAFDRARTAEPVSRIDFRCIRFPGLISAATLPSGGTSDYAPEMIHAAAQGKPYNCFVRPDTRIPFMAMPDGVEALLKLAASPADRLSRRVYNVGAFNPSAAEIRELVVNAFPGAAITFVPDLKRQGIVDSWPSDVDDGAARKDWGFAPRYDLKRAFSEYLLPTIRARYGR